MLVLAGCSLQQHDYPTLIGSQHMRCDRLFNEKGDLVETIETPAGFTVTPVEALRLAEVKGNFNCHHKWGGHIYADKYKYYLVAPGTGATLNLHNAFAMLRVVIDGTNGTVWEVRRGD
jgi:hypothetical protein